MPGRIRERYKRRIDEFVSNAKSLDTVLNPVVQAHFGVQAYIRDIGIEKIHKGVFRTYIQIFDPSRDQQTKKQWRIVCKVSRNPNEDTRAYKLMRQLWRHGFASDASDGIHVAQPLSFLPERGLLFMEEVPGRKVRNLIDKRSDPMYMRSVARALAKLHRCTFILPDSHTIQSQLRPVLYKKLAETYPGLAAEIDHITEQSARIAAGFGDVPQTPVHGDFHLGQVHINGAKLWLLDIGNLKYGDPAIDVGNFLVFLSSKKNPLANLQELINAFETEYRSIMGPEIIRRVPLFAGFTYMRRACKLFRLQVKDSESAIKNMVHQAVRCIDDWEIRHLKP